MKIGNIDKDGIIERGKTNQGYVFKDTEAFEKREGVCYVPELTDYEYTYEDILDDCNGSEEVAEMIFESLDWQHPSSLYQDYINNDEICECSNCNKTFISYEVSNCPFCGAEK